MSILSGNLSSSLNNSWSSSNQVSPNPTAGPSPAHQPGFPGPGGTYSPQKGSNATSPQHSTTRSPQDSTGPNRPDYSRSHFDTAFGGNKNANANENNKNAGTKPKSGDVFGDLLGSQGYQFASKRENSPRTINDMRKEELVKDMDPEKLKILEWVNVNYFNYYTIC